MTELQALTELCQELRNWFVRQIYTGYVTIADGQIYIANGNATPTILDGQYYRIVGSVFSDGVHKRGEDDMTLSDETFEGAVWTMAVPAPVLALAEDIKAWREAYEATDSQAMSPYTSESFGGYSYSKSTASGTDSGSAGWQSAFKARMNAWRKIL